MRYNYHNAMHLLLLRKILLLLTKDSYIYDYVRVVQLVLVVVLLKHALPLWHLLLQLRPAFLHGHLLVLQNLQRQEEPYSIPNEALRIASVCVIVMQGISSIERM